MHRDNNSKTTKKSTEEDCLQSKYWQYKDQQTGNNQTTNMGKNDSMDVLVTSDKSHEKTGTWLKKWNLKKETESLLIATENSAIRTNHIKE